MDGDGDGVERLLEQLRLWHGGLRPSPDTSPREPRRAVLPGLYLLTCMGGARDWGTGLPLKANLLGKMSRLEVHHIFPKAQLYKRKHPRPEVNALANFCFLTKDTNLDITDRLPEEYFPKIEAAHPGALASQWIPADEQLWKVERFRDFLEARKELLAAELNRRMEELLHGDTRWLAGPASTVPPAIAVGGGITSEAEEAEIEALNDWVESQGLPRGMVSWDFADPQSGEQRAVFDLAWPTGLQESLSQPVAVLLNEDAPTIRTASEAGFRCFTESEAFRRYVVAEVLGAGAPG
ncbi:MAG: hypothetical protein H6699_12680 [Myxococcales bacterium]|nr:hypothetical protein [Myxococcales bacterium]